MLTISNDRNKQADLLMCSGKKRLEHHQDLEWIEINPIVKKEDNLGLTKTSMFLGEVTQDDNKDI